MTKQPVKLTIELSAYVSDILDELVAELNIRTAGSFTREEVALQMILRELRKVVDAL